MPPNETKIRRRIQEIGRARRLEAIPLGPLMVRRLDVAETLVRMVQQGDRWGERDGVYAMHMDVAIPPEWRSHVLALHLDLSSPVSRDSLATVEALVSIDGVPLHAIDRYHREILLPPEIAMLERFTVEIHAWSGIDDDHHTMHTLELQRIDPVADRLHQVMRVWGDAALHLPEYDPARIALGAALDAVTHILDFTTPEHFRASCQAALETLDAHLFTLRGSASDFFQPRATMIGHAHIDVAWLWRLKHTRMKAANTFTTALYHMERYPHFTFFASTPQLYQFVKDDHPDLYERIRAKIAAGQWEAEGGMWVEADTNITGGESLVRQFLVGARFFHEEFGVETRLLWLPDVFGYSAALPQIIKGAGAEYFLTTKISWNDTNRAPMDTFWWEGIDGTRVLSHFITARNAGSDRYATYNAEAWPGVLARSWREYRQREVNPELLVAYGYGDGGGGPTREMVEAAGMQSQPVSRQIPTGTPGFVREFMDRVAERVSADPRLPTWSGELYLEYHRGTYTSQARTKRNNRLAERDLHHAEWLAWAALHLCGRNYPTTELDAAWKIVLTHQFHDILPGSSIGPVYADAEEHYAMVRGLTEGIVSAAQDAIAVNINAPAGALVAWNGLGWQRGGVVRLEAGHAATLGLPHQPLADGWALVLAPEVPALGYRAFAPETLPSLPPTSPFTVSPRSMDGPFYTLEWNERGQLTRLYDKTAGREVLAAGERGNVLQMFEDKPLNFDAWDIDAFYEEKSWELDDLAEVQVIETGPLRAGVQFTWRYLDRTIVTQRLYCSATDPRIDFATEVEWHEHQTLLKAAFPVAVHAHDATAEIQFGAVRRPTHRNTSWDRARFETCAHKWFDLSEGDYGVAILNDCKYGYDVHGNVMRQTLLKGGISPDPQADQGHHVFTYSLLPHAGDCFSGGVARAAYALNYPLLHTVRDSAPGTLPPEWSLASSNTDHVIIETVKQAEAGRDLVLRIYECANRRGPVTITLPFAARAVTETNLLEAPIAGAVPTLAPDGRGFTTSVTPYQIKTFVITAVRIAGE